MQAFVIRPYHPDDEGEVQEITFRTGFQGEDLTGRGYFDDRRLFFLIYIYYYTRYEPEHFFVVMDHQSKKVVGFIGGTTDTHAQERNYERLIVPRLAARAILVTSWRYPRTFRNFMQMRNTLDDIDQERIDEIAGVYPAHLHIDLAPGTQGQGLGGRLISHFEDHLRHRDAMGVHLLTTNYNQKALRFYKKHGYEIVYETGVIHHPMLDDLRLLGFCKTVK